MAGKEKDGTRPVVEAKIARKNGSRSSKLPLLSSVFLATFATLYLSNFSLRNGNHAVCSASGAASIYTVDESNPMVECMTIAGSRIVHTGTRDSMQNPLGDNAFTRTVGSNSIARTVLEFLGVYPKIHHLAPGSIVVPGLADSHGHILEYGYKMNLPLDGAASIDDVINRVKAYINAHPDILNDPTRWIEGVGWDQNRWEGKQFPTAADFDRDPLLRGRPIALARVDIHAYWVSTRVLELMGELPDTVEGGSIVRDAAGNPTGLFVDNAMQLIPKPAWSEAQMREYFDLAMRDAVKHGLTSIHDAGSSPEGIHFIKKLAEEGSIPIRLYLMGMVNSDEYWGHQIPRLENYGKHGMLNVRSIKLVTDGALGSWGAALLEPYTDKPSEQGIMRSSADVLGKLVTQFWNDGWQVNIHCIGDRANHVVLDIYESIIERQGGNVTEWRPRIEHAQIMTLDDLKRIGRLGVIASVQPSHATSDMGYAEDRLGPERIRGAYAYQSLLQASPLKVLALGSDFPVEGIDPLLGFYAAVSRTDANGESPHGPGGWFPEQKLTRAQALKGMTLDAAYASFAETTRGSLAPGKFADYIILDKNIMDPDAPFQDILRTAVKATVVGGRLVYGQL
ncbi:hypothetical protein PLICRDRAFT_180263 [Plicaturopsis crispa FD-325 SS-3]|uniref:Amidohydrolase 3 domain-containing protein n=1 Tax=Plicaturopsis crispa FD-325 SS-3 TaxID=944288 RepID=A0A0C9SKF8_PLICR|nr:hypothetical protein PLICRDRAFT_180263 [Plicaturopsis crispa FD-325 SS-3]